MKRTIRLTESDLHKIVENSVKRVIREMDDDEYVEVGLPPEDDDEEWPEIHHKNSKHGYVPKGKLNRYVTRFGKKYRSNPM